MRQGARGFGSGCLGGEGGRLTAPEAKVVDSAAAGGRALSLYPSKILSPFKGIFKQRFGLAIDSTIFRNERFFNHHAGRAHDCTVP
jgi:hypothetical protein